MVAHYIFLFQVFSSFVFSYVSIYRFIFVLSLIFRSMWQRVMHIFSTSGSFLTLYIIVNWVCRCIPGTSGVNMHINPIAVLLYFCCQRIKPIHFKPYMCSFVSNKVAFYDVKGILLETTSHPFSALPGS